MATIICATCREIIEVPDELWAWGDPEFVAEPYYCDACDPDDGEDLWLYDDVPYFRSE